MKKFAITYDGFENSGVSKVKADNVEDALISWKFAIYKGDTMESAKKEWEEVKREQAENDNDARWLKASIGTWLDYESGCGGEMDIAISVINLENGEIEWKTSNEGNRNILLAEYGAYEPMVG